MIVSRTVLLFGLTFFQCFQFPDRNKCWAQRAGSGNQTQQDRRIVPQRGSATPKSATPDSAITVQLDSLPDPPDEIRRLIKTGDVKLSRSWTDGQDADDPFGRDRRILAETRFTMSHSYRSNQRWNVNRTGPTADVLVTVRFTKIQFETKHEMWFKKLPSTEDFWADPLVQHEFDHVRLSTDSRLRKHFIDELRKTKTIRRSIPKNARVDAVLVRDWVAEFVKEAFDATSELASIRYRELDRLTLHGQRMIDPESELASVLQSASASPDRR